MRISGFQKMTMLDFPGRVAATVFLHGCNLRCPFCHNARLVSRAAEEEIDETEIFSYLEKRKGILDGVCITGGEPLMQDGVADFTRKIKEMGLAVKLDTNGFYPQKLKALVNEGLIDYVAMDIKNSPELYPATCGIETLKIAAAEESKEFLLSGAVDYEFRTTVVRELHTEKSIKEAAEWISGAKKYFLQKFVDSGDILSSGMSAHSDEFMKQAQDIASQFVEKVELRGM